MIGKIVNLRNAVMQAPGKMLAALRWAAKAPIIFGLWLVNPVVSRYIRGETTREVTNVFLIPLKDAPFFYSTMRWLTVLALATTAAALTLAPPERGVAGTLEKLGTYGAGIFGIVTLGSILLVRPYRYLQEVVMNQATKLYERVERRYRPESWRLKAIQTEEENQELREQAARDREQAERDRNRIAELESRVKELESERRNKPPQE